MPTRPCEKGGNRLELGVSIRMWEDDVVALVCGCRLLFEKTRLLLHVSCERAGGRMKSKLEATRLWGVAVLDCIVVRDCPIY